MNVDRRKSKAKWSSVEVEKSKLEIPPRVFVGDFAVERTRAYRLMRKHGLTDWLCKIVHLKPPKRRRVAFGSYKPTERKGIAMGSCNSERKTIYLDRNHVLRGPQREVRETILHEIAHALEPDERHNRHWQNRARSIGVSEREIVRYRLY